MEIRAANPGEAEILGALALRSKAHWGYSREFLDACRRELSVSEDTIRCGRAFVIAEDGVPVGFYTLEPLSPSRVELGHLFVEPGRIRQQVGRQLMTHAANVARRRGFHVLVIQGDPNAAAFYASCGARRIGTKPSQSIPGRSLPLFELDLAASQRGAA